MPATRRKSPARKGTRSKARRAPAKRRRPRMPLLGQRERDVLALALVALGVFLAFVLYGGWQGGPIGHGLATASAWLVGRARVLGATGARDRRPLDAARPARRDARAARIGGACLLAAVTLALAGGLFGLADAPAHSGFVAAEFKAHGGLPGQAQYEVAERLVGSLGVTLLVVFLALAALVLISGASLAGALRARAPVCRDNTPRAGPLRARSRRGAAHR